MTIAFYYLNHHENITTAGRKNTLRKVIAHRERSLQEPAEGTLDEVWAQIHKYNKQGVIPWVHVCPCAAEIYGECVLYVHATMDDAVLAYNEAADGI